MQNPGKRIFLYIYLYFTYITEYSGLPVILGAGELFQGQAPLAPKRGQIQDIQ